MFKFSFFQYLYLVSVRLKVKIENSQELPQQIVFVWLPINVEHSTNSCKIIAILKLTFAWSAPYTRRLPGQNGLA